ncbi:hypothetical protein [Spirosoma arcticum]
MSYLTLKEASEATGLNEGTIRRLCKKAETKPFIEMKKGKQGAMYTIQANYLFDVYPPSKSSKDSAYTRVDNGSTTVDKESTQAYTDLLTAKDEIIQLLKSETAYLRAENTSLREENRELKLLPSPSSTGSDPEKPVDQQPRNLWKRLFGKR